MRTWKITSSTSSSVLRGVTMYAFGTTWESRKGGKGGGEGGRIRSRSTMHQTLDDTSEGTHQWGPLPLNLVINSTAQAWGSPPRYQLQNRTTLRTFNLHHAPVWRS